MTNPVRDLQNAANGLTTEEVVDSIAKSIEHTLGEGSSYLIFQTLRLIYSLDRESLAKQLDYFQIILCRMLGEPLANRIATVAAKEMNKKRISIA